MEFCNLTDYHIKINPVAIVTHIYPTSENVRYTLFVKDIGHLIVDEKYIDKLEKIEGV